MDFNKKEPQKKVLRFLLNKKTLQLKFDTISQKGYSENLFMAYGNYYNLIIKAKIC